MEQSVLIAIKSGLFLIEKCLRDILQQTRPHSDSKNWLLRVRNSDISGPAANKLAVKAEEMLKEIQELQRLFDIAKDTESTRWRSQRPKPNLVYTKRTLPGQVARIRADAA